MLVVGQYFRIAAEFTGKNNFSHVIMLEKEQSHQLVKNGVYSYYNFLIIAFQDIHPILVFLFGQLVLKL